MFQGSRPEGATETQIHGQNPENLIEKIIRGRIYESAYWKEHCFALTAETLVDKALDLTSIGGYYGLQKPTEFLCLTLRLLQLQPEKDIIAVYLQNEDHKYLTALAAFYLRLTYRSVDVYRYLEPLLLDKRKLRMRDPQGNYYLSYMDEFADLLLQNDHACQIQLPRIVKRYVHVEAKDLEERVSPLEEDLDLMEESETLNVASHASDNENDVGETVDANLVDNEGNENKITDEGEIGMEDDQTGKKKKYSQKKIKSLFKKDSSRTKVETEVNQGDSAESGAKESMSIEETNKMRLALGLKPLK